MSRYHRQMLLPQIGAAGQDRLAASRVLLIGCGALGTHLAEQLVRAGVGFLRLVDRDIVELTNLQRQVLFDESHAARGWPKAAAAAERLAAINSTVTIEPQVIDAHAGNIESLLDAPERSGDLSPSPGTPGEGRGGGLIAAAKDVPHPTPPVPPPEYRERGPHPFEPHPIEGRIDLILDGTDNVATRYLLNDVAVKHNIPWIYGACVGVEGRMMAVRPGVTACLRCVFPNPPRAEELPTCDTAGVLGSAAAVVASLQGVAALKMLTGPSPAEELLSFDLWSGRFHRLSLADAKRPDCPCCGKRQFEFLSRPPADSTLTLCGRDAVQIRGDRPTALDDFASRWALLGKVVLNRFFLRLELADPPGLRLTLFADGRLLVQGMRDLARAKSIYARFVGA